MAKTNLDAGESTYPTPVSSDDSSDMLVDTQHSESVLNSTGTRKRSFADTSIRKQNQNKPSKQQSKQSTAKQALSESEKEKKRLMNRVYAQRSRLKKTNELEELKDRCEEQEVIIEIYKKAISILHTRHKGIAPSWTIRSIDWFPSQASRHKPSFQARCLLPDTDERFYAELGNNAYGQLTQPKLEPTSAEDAPPAVLDFNFSAESKPVIDPNVMLLTDLSYHNSVSSQQMTLQSGGTTIATSTQKLMPINASAVGLNQDFSRSSGTSQSSFQQLTPSSLKTVVSQPAPSLSGSTKSLQQMRSISADSVDAHSPEFLNVSMANPNPGDSTCLLELRPLNEKDSATMHLHPKLKSYSEMPSCSSHKQTESNVPPTMSQQTHSKPLIIKQILSDPKGVSPHILDKLNLQMQGILPIEAHKVVSGTHQYPHSEKGSLVVFQVIRDPSKEKPDKTLIQPVATGQAMKSEHPTECSENNQTCYCNSKTAQPLAKGLDKAILQKLLTNSTCVKDLCSKTEKNKTEEFVPCNQPEQFEKDLNKQNMERNSSVSHAGNQPSMFVFSPSTSQIHPANIPHDSILFQMPALSKDAASDHNEEHQLCPSTLRDEVQVSSAGRTHSLSFAGQKTPSFGYIKDVEMSQQGKPITTHENPVAVPSRPRVEEEDLNSRTPKLLPNGGVRPFENIIIPTVSGSALTEMTSHATTKSVYDGTRNGIAGFSPPAPSSPAVSFQTSSTYVFGTNFPQTSVTEQKGGQASCESDYLCALNSKAGLSSLRSLDIEMDGDMDLESLTATIQNGP